MSTHPPSIRDIAHASGFGKSTVASALANSPLVTSETTRIIQEAAKKLGYRRDPLVADLAARRWRSRPSASSPKIGYIFDYGEEEVRGTSPIQTIKDAAAPYGYDVDSMDLREFASDARASLALFTRGYRGLLIGRILRKNHPLELEWDRFTAVACDQGFIRPPLHMVLLDRRAAAEQATRTAIERGYRRPGYVHLVHSEREAVDPARLGGYLAARSGLPRNDHLPVHVGLYHDRIGASMVEWLRTTRPDVVIGFNDLVVWWLRQAGVRLPEDIAFVSIDHDPKSGADVTGVIGSNSPVYHAAVELLIGQIHLNAVGIPHPLQTLLVEPEWHEGATLPRRAADSPSSTHPSRSRRNLAV
ncbi:MAG: LacI family DNA-binding transcriptional regulator [Phycisphaerae bacterium]|nr:LacI family DNA-binding transcriptional regulator [Phycisphaerae bacterium]